MGGAWSRDRCQIVRYSSIGRRGSTALVASLNRRALHIAIRTIDAEIAFERSQECPTAFAVIVELTGVGWHQFLRFVTAFRARQSRKRLNFNDLGHIRMIIANGINTGTVYLFLLIGPRVNRQ